MLLQLLPPSLGILINHAEIEVIDEAMEIQESTILRVLPVSSNSPQQFSRDILPCEFGFGVLLI
jgi:hypothetical protein